MVSNFFSVLCFFAMSNHTVICRSSTWYHQLTAQFDDEMDCNVQYPSKSFAGVHRVIWSVGSSLSNCDEKCEDDNQNFEVLFAIIFSILGPKFSASAIRSGRQLHYLKAICTLIELEQISLTKALYFAVRASIFCTVPLAEHGVRGWRVVEMEPLSSPTLSAPDTTISEGIAVTAAYPTPF